MSLFIRLWIIGTTIALAACGIATATYIFVTEQQHLALARHEAASIGRLLSHAMSVDLSEQRSGADQLALLRGRALQFMSSGRLLSLTIVDAEAGEPVVQEVLPGLEAEEAWQKLGSSPFDKVVELPANNLHQVDNTFYVLSPVMDRTGAVRFILAFGLPSQTLTISDDNLPLFISLATALSLILGLITAAVLTGQVGRPIRLLTTAADRLESGHFDTAALTPLIGRRDEIGRLARTVLRLVQALDHLGAQMDRASQRNSDQKEERDDR